MIARVKTQDTLRRPASGRAGRSIWVPRREQDPNAPSNLAGYPTSSTSTAIRPNSTRKSRSHDRSRSRM